MKILIMGGTGFISQCVAEHFINENYIVDIFTRGQRKSNIQGFRTHYIGDRTCPDDLKQLTDDYHYVLDITGYTEADVDLLSRQLNATSLKRYILCSSGAVYKASDLILDETAETGHNPFWNSYGLSKLDAENYLLNGNLPVTIVRPTYIYGPMNNLYRESYFFDRLLEQKPIKYPQGAFSIQFLHIHDFSMILSSIMASDQSMGEIYNVTHEEILTFEEMLEAFEKVTGLKTEKIPVPQEPSSAARRYFPFRAITYKLSIDKLKEHGLHVPKFNLHKGLKQTYEWYKTAKPKLHDQSMIDIEK